MKHRDLIASVFKRVLGLTSAFLLLAAMRCPAAAWEGVDDFSSGISTNNWAFHKGNSGDVRVLGTNGHATFIAPAMLADDTSEALIWHGNPTAGEDWNVEVTGHVSAPSSRLWLSAWSMDTPFPSSSYYYVEMYQRADRGFIVGLTGTWRAIVPTTIETRII